MAIWAYYAACTSCQMHQFSPVGKMQTQLHLVTAARLELQQAWAAFHHDRPAIAPAVNVLDAGHRPVSEESSQGFPVKRTGEPHVQRQTAVGGGPLGTGSSRPELDRRGAKHSGAIPVELPDATETGHIRYLGYRYIGLIKQAAREMNAARPGEAAWGNPEMHHEQAAEMTT